MRPHGGIMPLITPKTMIVCTSNRNQPNQFRDHYSDKHFHSSTIGSTSTTAGKLRSLDSGHLVRPALRRLRTSSSAHLVGREAWNSDVVLTFEDHLDVARLESRAAAQLAELTGGGNEIVDEVVRNLEEDLFWKC